MSATAAIIGGISAAGGLGSAALSSSAAGNAANAQVGGADYAANLEHQDAQQALQFNEKQWQQQQSNIQPWLQTGQGGLSMLANLLGISMPGGSTTGQTPGGGLAPLGGPSGGAGPMTPGAPGMAPGNPAVPGGRMPMSTAPVGIGTARGDFGDTGNPQRISADGNGGGLPVSMQPAGAPGAPGAHPPGFGSLLTPFGEEFQAPTDVTEQNDPGYKFRLNQGLDALQNSAAARGALLNGGTARDLEDYAQNDASNEYGNVYSRALGQYQQRYNIFQQHQADTFNRLAALSGIGQTAAGQLGQFGAGASSNTANILLGSGAQIGQQANNAAAARASGYIGSANAYGGAFSGLGGNLSQLAMMQQLMNGYANTNWTIPGANESTGTGY